MQSAEIASDFNKLNEWKSQGCIGIYKEVGDCSGEEWAGQRESVKPVMVNPRTVLLNAKRIKIYMYIK